MAYSPNFAPSQKLTDLTIDQGKVEKTVVTFPVITKSFGSLATTTPIVLTKVTANIANNTNTFTTQVLAAAANPTNTVLVTFGGTAAATSCTVTPNDGTNNPTTQASASIATATPIVLTKTLAAKPGVLGNTNTFTIQILAAAANAGGKVLVDVTGTAEAIVCTITPDTTPLDLTSAQLVDLINNGVHANVTLTDLGGLLDDQTATGGGAVVFVNGGEGDGLIGTFANGVNTAVTLTTAELVALINTGLVAGKTVTITDAGALRNDQTATGGGAHPLVDAGEGDAVVCTFAGATMSQADYLRLYTNSVGLSIWLDVDALGTAPTGALYVASASSVKVPATSGMTAAQTATAAYEELIADDNFKRLFSVDDNLDGTLTIWNDRSGNVTNAAPKNAGDGGVGSITVVVTAGRSATNFVASNPGALTIEPAIIS